MVSTSFSTLETVLVWMTPSERVSWCKGTPRLRAPLSIKEWTSHLIRQLLSPLLSRIITRLILLINNNSSYSSHHNPILRLPPTGTASYNRWQFWAQASVGQVGSHHSPNQIRLQLSRRSCRAWMPLSNRPQHTPRIQTWHQLVVYNYLDNTTGHKWALATWVQ